MTELIARLRDAAKNVVRHVVCTTDVDRDYVAQLECALRDSIPALEAAQLNDRRYRHIRSKQTAIAVYFYRNGKLDEVIEGNPDQLDNALDIQIDALSAQVKPNEQ